MDADKPYFFYCILKQTIKTSPDHQSDNKLSKGTNVCRKTWKDIGYMLLKDLL